MVPPLTSFTTSREGTAKVTAAAGSVVATGIAIIAAATALATNGGETSPIKVGRDNTSLLPPSLIATRYRVGLHSVCAGGGMILAGGAGRPLQKKTPKIG